MQTPPRKPINPFNVILLVIGILFVLTVCGYSVMAVKGSRPFGTSEATASGQWLLNFLDKHGFTALMTELVILALTTFAAIGTDDYWTRRAAATKKADSLEPNRDSSQDVDGPVS